MRRYTLLRNILLLFFVVSNVITHTFSLDFYEQKATASEYKSTKQRPHHIMSNILFDYAIIRDKVVSPLLYHSLAGGFVLGYEYRTQNHEHRVLLYLIGGTLTRPGLDRMHGRGAYKNTFPLLIVQIFFEYSFIIPVFTHKQWQLGVGGMVDSFAEGRAYSHMWSPPIVSFSSTWDIGAVVATAWNPTTQHYLRCRFTMPIMSIVKRPEWNLANPKMETNLNKNPLIVLYANPRITSVHKWFRFTFEVKHEWKITKLMQLNTEYRSTLLLSNLPRFFGTFSNQLSIGVSFRL